MPDLVHRYLSILRQIREGRRSGLMSDDCEWQLASEADAVWLRMSEEECSEAQCLWSIEVSGERR